MAPLHAALSALSAAACPSGDRATQGRLLSGGEVAQVHLLAIALHLRARKGLDFDPLLGRTPK